jgi:hypothetical protein
MKKTISILLFLLIGHSLKAQTIFNTDKWDSTNVYYYSLIQYCKYLQVLKTPPGEVLVEKNYLFTDKLPKTIFDYQLRYISIDHLTKLLKSKKHKEETFVRIVPIQIEGNYIVINVIPFSAKLEKKQLKFINSGGLGIYFDYDCQSEKYRFIKVTRGSI